MDFPRWVFTSPGPLECNGGTYAQELVKSKEEYDAALEADFKGTLPEALKAKVKEKEKPESGEKAESESQGVVVKRGRKPKNA